MTQPTTAREAAERNAQAIMSGNLSQLMADITPEVLAQVMAMGAQAGGLSPAQMPNIEGYELKDFGPQEDGGELEHGLGVGREEIPALQPRGPGVREQMLRRVANGVERGEGELRACRGGR